MIFVTVGTDHHPFDRLFKKIDELIGGKIITEKVFAQIGYLDYKPQKFEYKNLLTFKKMNSFTKQARIVITHGGPGSIVLALSYGKIPIIVPRQEKYAEAVDTHQVPFVKELEEKKKVIAVYEIKDLAEKIINYNSIVQKMGIPQNYQEVLKEKTENFAKRLDKICRELCRNVEGRC